jgi:hypothetical protein
LAKLYLDENYNPLTQTDLEEIIKTNKQYTMIQDIITYEFEVDQSIVESIEKYDLIIKSLYKLTKDNSEISTINIPNVGNITRI